MENKTKKEMDEVITELKKFTSRVSIWHDPVDLALIGRFESYEVIVPQYEYLIPFSPDGFGNFYCFDTRVKTNGGDSNQIVFWYSNYEYSESDPPEVTHQGLADFIKDWIIVSNLEYYDYNGDKRE